MNYIYASLFLFIISYCLTLNYANEEYATVEENLAQQNFNDAVFAILENKCNTCHATKRHVATFTKENMSSSAPAIYEQVYIKKKMPKGRKVKLTETEISTLKRWIDLVAVANEPSKN